MGTLESLAWVIIGLGLGLLFVRGAMKIGRGSRGSTLAHAPSAFSGQLMPVALSAAALVAALFIILSNSASGESQKWAYGVVGVVLGYWLKGS
jgi:hypothetical protein